MVTNSKLIRLIGVEPITFGTEIQRSIQLSYKRLLIKTVKTEISQNFKRKR